MKSWGTVWYAIRAHVWRVSLTACIWCLWGGVAFSSVHSQGGLPTPRGYVSDYANVLSLEWHERIRSVCHELEDRTGVEMLVVTISSVHPFAHAQEYGIRLYEAWRIGTAQQERGILLLTALQEQQAVVVLGRNLLSAIPQSTLDRLSERHLRPMFQTAQFGKELYQAVVMLAAEAGENTASADRRSPSQTGFWMNVGVVLLMLFVLWRFTRPERKHPFQRWRRGEYWGTGQGGFGGNFGGLGGGMGGNSLS
ncbi:MAG: TPM domain-containing protein [Nitrospirae bacterium]|nr:MAG: TPM domain-containing protein [Nitrospirota bacterium]